MKKFATISLSLLACLFCPALSGTAKAAVTGFSYTTPGGLPDGYVFSYSSPDGVDVHFGLPPLVNGSYSFDATYRWDPFSAIWGEYRTYLGFAGALPPNSMAVFSYNATKGPYDSMFTYGKSWVYGNASVDIHSSDYGYQGNASAVMSGLDYHYESSSGYNTVDGSIADPLVFASAQITGESTATLIIKNLSSGIAIFDAYLIKDLSEAGPTVIHADLQVSSVPLPAALPMFGAGLTALMGLGARRKYRKGCDNGAVVAA